MTQKTRCQKCGWLTNAKISKCQNCSANLLEQYSLINNDYCGKAHWTNLNKVKHHKNGKKQNALPSMKKR